MKEKLLELLRDATPNHSEEFFDALAEDILAVIIRAITPFADDAVGDVEHEVLSVYNSRFGTALHNSFWAHPPEQMEGLPVAEFERISKAMIQTMLLELPGETLKRRLNELSSEKDLTIN